jgi:hypothetical protein
VTGEPQTKSLAKARAANFTTSIQNNCGTAAGSRLIIGDRVAVFEHVEELAVDHISARAARQQTLWAPRKDVKCDLARKLRLWKPRFVFGHILPDYSRAHKAIKNYTAPLMAMLVRPKYVSLDTASWVKLIRDLALPEVQRILVILRSGDLIPYITFEHVLELFQVDTQKQREERLKFFRNLELVATPKIFSDPPWAKTPVCTSCMDVREFEIRSLLHDPGLTLDQVVSSVRSDAIGGTTSGKEIANDPVLREIACSNRMPGILELNRAAASVAYASPVNPNEKIPDAGGYSMTDPQTAALLGPALTSMFAARLQILGDPKLKDPTIVAKAIFENSWKILEPQYDVSVRDPFRELAKKVLGLEMSRLPRNPKQSDLITETLYRSRMAVDERRMRLTDREAYSKIPREAIPSMVAWFALEEEITKNHPKADGGNMIDFPLAALGLYVDHVEVDKRVLDALQKAARKTALLNGILSKAFRSKDLKDLLSNLNAFRARS